MISPIILEISEEIQLRELTSDDAVVFYKLVTNDRSRFVRYFPVTVENTVTPEATGKFLHEEQDLKLKQKFTLGIFHLDKLVGIIYIKSFDWRVLKCELGYFIDRNYEGKGISSAALKQVIEFCFEQLRMNKIFLKVDPQNISSSRLALKNGFEKEGTLRKEFRIETGELVDLDYYGLIRTID